MIIYKEPSTEPIRSHVPNLYPDFANFSCFYPKCITGSWHETGAYGNLSWCVSSYNCCSASRFGVCIINCNSDNGYLACIISIGYGGNCCRYFCRFFSIGECSFFKNTNYSYIDLSIQGDYLENGYFEPGGSHYCINNRIFDKSTGCNIELAITTGKYLMCCDIINNCIHIKKMCGDNWVTYANYCSLNIDFSNLRYCFWVCGYNSIISSLCLSFKINKMAYLNEDNYKKLLYI